MSHHDLISERKSDVCKIFEFNQGALKVASIALCAADAASLQELISCSMLSWNEVCAQSGVESLVPTSECVCVSLHSRHVFLAKRRQKQSWHFFLQTHYSATFTNAADYWEEMIIISWGVPSGLRPVPGRRYDESFRDQQKITVLPMFGQLPNAKLKVKSIRSSCINQGPNYQHFPVVRPEKCICLPLCEYLLRQCRSYPGQGASHNEPQQQCLEKTRSKSRYVTCTSMVA
jgi:hypothetical protein